MHQNNIGLYAGPGGRDVTSARAEPVYLVSSAPFLAD